MNLQKSKPGKLPVFEYCNVTDDDDQSILSSTSTSSLSSSSSGSSSSSTSITTISFPSSSGSDDEKDSQMQRKRKVKCNVKDALQRLKRTRLAAVQSPPAPATNNETTVSERSSGNSSGVEACTSNGSTSTDTVDSGVYVYSGIGLPKYKFTSFKRSQKRKYRTRPVSRSSTASSSSSDSEWRAEGKNQY